MPIPSPKRAFQYAVYLLARTIETAVLLTPVETGMAIGRWLGRLAWRIDKRHRRIAVSNIRQVYGDRLTEREARRLARRSFVHMGSVFAEGIYLPKLVRYDTWHRYAVFHGYGRFFRYMFRGRGAIVVTAHLGNWELASYVSSAMAFPLFSIARPPSNPFIAERVRMVREAAGGETIEKKGAWDRMEEVLESGGILAFLADQHAGRMGVWVDFLGRPASTHKAIALLALSMNVPIVVVYTYRIGRRFKYVLRFQEYIYPEAYADDPNAVVSITQRFTDILGDAVMQHPDQWLWAHRRWREPRRRGRRRSNRSEITALGPAEKPGDPPS